MSTVIPIICGSTDTKIPNKQKVLFTELQPITNEDAVKPKPNFFDGAQLRDITLEVRKDVASTVIPTKHPSVPVAPNFFLEVKGPRGSPVVARRQACYAGAYGARAMSTMQAYDSETEPTYDGNAHTYSSTYCSGTLSLYAHHATAPTTFGGRPEYHMTQLRSFSMDTRQTFIAGATAFRNARDLAKRHRDGFIQAANARASEAELVAAQDDVTETYQEEHPIPSPWQDAHDALQKDIADACDCDP